MGSEALTWEPVKPCVGRGAGDGWMDGSRDLWGVPRPSIAPSGWGFTCLAQAQSAW